MFNSFVDNFINMYMSNGIHIVVLNVHEVLHEKSEEKKLKFDFSFFLFYNVFTLQYTKKCTYRFTMGHSSCFQWLHTKEWNFV